MFIVNFVDFIVMVTGPDYYVHFGVCNMPPCILTESRNLTEWQTGKDMN